MQLCRELSTRAGMLLEDASAKAVLMRDVDPHELKRTIHEAREMTEQAVVLFTAAEALLQE